MTIKDVRQSVNMTQKEFADFFGIPQRTLEGWDSGRREPPGYLLDLIKYKIEKERMNMRNLGELVLSEGREYEDVYYAAVEGIDIIITKDKSDLEFYDSIGAIKVYHSGTYFGTQEEMKDWITDKVFDYLVDGGLIVKDGENIIGDFFWRWA